MLTVWFGGLAGLCAYVGIKRSERRLNELAIRSEESAMLYELGHPDGVLVSMWILQGRAVTGQDRGAVWVEDGRLMFCGPRTSFVLTREDIDGGLKLTKRGPGEMELQLKRETPAGPLSVAFTTLIGDRPFKKPVLLTITAWLNATGDTEPGQLPPTALAPNLPPIPVIRIGLTFRHIGLVAVFGLLVLPFASAFEAVPLLAAVLLLLSAVAAAATYRHPTLRDRRRLEEP